MTTKKNTAKTTGAKDPAEGLTHEHAVAITERLRIDLDGDSNRLARILLLLRWLAYNATDDERETLYIETEVNFAAFIDGTDAAIREQMSRQLAALRKESAR
jgi:hypothetical protein